MAYERISIYKAKERITKGYQTIVVPSKMRPDSVFASIIERVADFEKWYNAYKFYNCNNETGNTIAFYLAS